MSDYARSLVRRMLEAPTVVPRRASRFEPELGAIRLEQGEILVESPGRSSVSPPGATIEVAPATRPNPGPISTAAFGIARDRPTTPASGLRQPPARMAPALTPPDAGPSTPLIAPPDRAPEGDLLTRPIPVAEPGPLDPPIMLATDVAMPELEIVRLPHVEPQIEPSVQLPTEPSIESPTETPAELRITPTAEPHPEQSEIRLRRQGRLLRGAMSAEAVDPTPVDGSRELAIDPAAPEPAPRIRHDSAPAAARRKPDGWLIERSSEPDGIVEVHIGRIEVHASTPPAPRPRPRVPPMTLDEYLKRRKERGS